MPQAENAANTIIRTQYGIRWTKYGAISLVKKEGTTSKRRTTPLGILGPTRSKAAERIIT
jgi:hypothetical protein